MMIEKEIQGVKFKIELDEKISSRIGFISYNTSEHMVHTMTPSLLNDLFCKKDKDKDGKPIDELSILIDGRCSKYDIIIGYGKGLHVIGDSISEEYEILDVLNKHLSTLSEADTSTKIVYIITDKQISIEELKSEINKHVIDTDLEKYNINVLVNILASNGEGYAK